MRSTFVVAVVLVLAGLAGCLRTPPDDGPDPDPGMPAPVVVDGLVVGTASTPKGPVDYRLASGAVSSFVFPADGTVAFPPNVFLIDGDRFEARKEATVTAGHELRLLVPPGATSLALTFQGNVLEINVTDTAQGLFSGENIVEWFKIQRDEYPDRCNGCPNYARAQDYFAGLFDSFGMAQVEVDPYGTNPVHAEFANVVAYRYPKLDTMRPFYLGVGGHYDVVTGTTEGAFDNTAGTLATLEMARVFGQFNWTHNYFFGLWGGEEAGLQGSNFFVKTNPQVAAQMKAYVNLDVSAFSWPAPMPASETSELPDCAQPLPRGGDATQFCPDPVLVAAGPDGPVADGLLEWMQSIQHDIVVGYPDAYFIYETVVGGQVDGYAGVNAQSDHTSFIAGGVPSYFLFNANALKNPIQIHNERDTLDNWTKYMLQNHLVQLDEELAPQERAQGEELMAKSLETYLWLTFYVFLLHDLEIVGALEPPVPSA